jgi:hypothetical protein
VIKYLVKLVSFTLSLQRKATKKKEEGVRGEVGRGAEGKRESRKCIEEKEIRGGGAQDTGSR